MEFHWNSYGTSLEQQASNAPAKGKQHALYGPALSARPGAGPAVKPASEDSCAGRGRDAVRGPVGGCRDRLPAGAGIIPKYIVDI
jgi:hypothetical protein